MVSLTKLSLRHDSAQNTARLKRRRAAEKRLKFYGLAAIVVSALALFTLVWSVAGKAGMALTETYVSMSIPLHTAELDPDATGDPAAIGRANFDGFVKDLLKGEFPYASGRSERRELYDILSSGAAFELRDRVMADPALIGQTVEHSLLASDLVDLYLKGDFGQLIELPATGFMHLTPEGDSVSVQFDSPILIEAMDALRLSLREQARQTRRQASYEENGRAFYDAALAEAETDAERADAEAQITARTAARDVLLAQAQAFEDQADASGLDAELGLDSPSILVHTGDVWLHMTHINASGGRAEVWGELEENLEIQPGQWRAAFTELSSHQRKITDLQIAIVETLRDNGQIETRFNARFFTSGDSREAELAGIWGAVVGTFWTMLVTILLAFPLGAAAAIYLEEFAPKTRITGFIEVNINNLAAVPSIVFGLLGLSVFIGFFGVPRSAPLAGGLVLAVMTLPTIIIAARASIQAVPPSIRDAALGLGASKIQTAFHHVMPLAMPGILTGTIIGMARALGETAPLIMIGMVAFIVDIPTGITDNATVLPVQVFRWADFPERAFEYRTAAAICVLLVFLVLMNGFAVFLRKRFERRW